MKIINIAKTAVMTGLAIMTAPGIASAGCFDCHDTTGCLTPSKPQGSCADCHLGTGDVNDYQMNFTAATIDGNEWQNSGHGQPGIALDCAYCHDYDVRHGEPDNPFRLANTSTPDGAGQNTNCLACHGTDSAGVDADGPGSSFALVNSVLKIDANHAGGRHNELSDGGYFCWDCHDPHGDSNIAMIHNTVTSRSDGRFGIPAATAQVSFTSNSTGTDFAKSTPPFNGICQACHTATGHYTSTSGDGHNASARCMTCHEHQDGFKPNCQACHGYPPVVDTPRGVDGLVVSPAVTGSTTAGAHAVHVNNYNISCYTCHFDGMPDTPVIGDYRIQMGFDIHGFSGSGSIYNEQTLINSFSYQGTNGTAISAAGPPATCENIYCHSNGTAVTTSFADPATFPGPHQSSPTWDGSTTCSSCHDYGPSYAAGSPKANRHARHLQIFDGSINLDPNPCHVCHYATTTDGSTITNKENHVNRVYDVTPDTAVIFRQNLQTSMPVNFTYTYDPSGGTCSNITCHAGLLAETLSWGSSSSINAYASFTPGSVCGNITFAINPSSGTAPYTYYIDWESDGIWDYEGPNNVHAHTYSDITSSKIITSYVRDATARRSNNLTTTVTFTSGAANILPTVAVSPSVSGYTVTLTDQSFDPDYAACGHSGSGRAMIDWGPGGYVFYPFSPPLADTPSGQQFSYTYSTPGTYTIRYGLYDNVITYAEFYANIRVTVPQN